MAIPVCILSVILLILVLTPLGQTTNGATRWLRLGPITIMPGEIAKLAADIICTAWFLSEDTNQHKVHIETAYLPLIGQ